MTAVNYLLGEVEDLRRNWVWFLFLGVALIVLGRRSPSGRRR